MYNFYILTSHNHIFFKKMYTLFFLLKKLDIKSKKLKKNCGGKRVPNK